MKNSLPLLAICLILAAVCPAFAQEKDSHPDISFYTKLRMDYAKRPDFNPLWKSVEERQAVISAFKQNDFAKLVDLSKAWLKKCPVDAEVHFMRARALMETGDISNFASEFYFCYGLIQSIASSGDGQSEKTAFKVISGEEEFNLLGNFGAEPTGQSLQGTCDVIRCKLSNGNEVTYFFDISIPLAVEAKQAAPPAPPKSK